MTSTPTRPVDNVVIATKGLQDRNTNIIAGTTVENKGKLIVTEIFPSVQKHDIFYYCRFHLFRFLASFFSSLYSSVSQIIKYLCYSSSKCFHFCHLSFRLWIGQLVFRIRQLNWLFYTGYYLEAFSCLLA